MRDFGIRYEVTCNYEELLLYFVLAGGLFFIVNGQDYRVEVQGSVIEANSDSIEIIRTFQPANGNFQYPHDVFVSSNGSELYVAELDPHRVSKFLIMYKATKSPKSPLYERLDAQGIRNILFLNFYAKIIKVEYFETLIGKSLRFVKWQELPKNFVICPKKKKCMYLKIFGQMRLNIFKNHDDPGCFLNTG